MLLDRTEGGSTVRDLGVALEDALSIAKKIDIRELLSGFSRSCSQTDPASITFQGRLSTLRNHSFYSYRQGDDMRTQACQSAAIYLTAAL